MPRTPWRISPCSVSRLWFKDLADSPIDWSQFSLANVKDIRLKPKKIIREHQAEAIGDVIAGFKENDRGKLIMACGTGKTFTVAADRRGASPPASGRVLFLAPSISLVSQIAARMDGRGHVRRSMPSSVCSDTQGRQARRGGHQRPTIWPIPATTDAEEADQRQPSAVDARSGVTVVFSTYQSIQVIADAQKHGFGEFDLIICDEAHRTTGVTLAGRGRVRLRQGPR